MLVWCKNFNAAFLMCAFSSVDSTKITHMSDIPWKMCFFQCVSSPALWCFLRTTAVPRSWCWLFRWRYASCRGGTESWAGTCPAISPLLPSPRRICWLNTLRPSRSVCLKVGGSRTCSSSFVAPETVADYTTCSQSLKQWSILVKNIFLIYLKRFPNKSIMGKILFNCC